MSMVTMEKLKVGDRYRGVGDQKVFAVVEVFECSMDIRPIGEFTLLRVVRANNVQVVLCDEKGVRI